MAVYNEADFVMQGREVKDPEIAKDELELYYDVKGKKNSDVHKNKLLDMSGQGKDGELSGFNYDGELSGYDGDNGLVFDGFDDTLKMPELNGIDANNFTYQLNNNILAFTGDEVKTVRNGNVEVGGKNLFIGEALTHYRQSDNVHWEDFVLTYKRNNSSAYAGAAFKLNVEIGVTYTLSFEGVEGTGAIMILDETESAVTTRRFSTGGFSMSFTPAGTLVYIMFTDAAAVNENKAITNIQIEEGSAATDWTPAPEDLIETADLKGNILGDMEDIVDASPRDRQSGKEIFTEHADDSHVEVEVDGQSYQRFDPNARNMVPTKYEDWLVEHDYSKEEGALGVHSNRMAASWLIEVESNKSYYYDTGNPDIWYVIRTLDYNKTIEDESWGGSGSSGVKTTNSTTKYLGVGLYTTTSGVIVKDEFQAGNIKPIIQDASVTDRSFIEYVPKAPTPDHPIEIHSLNDFDVVSSIEKLTKGQLEEYDYDSEYENIDKINLSLNEPLRSVGDVKDRLFRDSDGLWKVERNVGEKTFNNSSGWSHHVFSNTEKDSYETKLVTAAFRKYRQIISDRFIGSLIQNTPINHIRMSSSGYLNFAVEKGMINNLSEWFSQNPFTILYEKAPSIETLDQELQGKLNTLKSFKGSNYVYTVQNTDSPYKEQLKPILHATFNSKDYLKETRTLTNLLIWARELTDEELIHHNQLFLNRFNLPSDRVIGEPIEQTLNLLHGGVVGHSLEQNYTINI